MTDRQSEHDARWGMFMDALGVGYRYEPAGHAQAP